MAKKKSDVNPSDADITPTQEVINETSIAKDDLVTVEYTPPNMDMDKITDAIGISESESNLNDTARVEIPTELENPTQAKIESKQVDTKLMSNAEIADMMKGTLDEIERCNEYIYAHADSDRRFAVYREELYTYRYKLRQLTIDSRWPNIPIKDIPHKPEVITDC